MLGSAAVGSPESTVSFSEGLCGWVSPTPGVVVREVKPGSCESPPPWEPGLLLPPCSIQGLLRDLRSEAQPLWAPEPMGLIVFSCLALAPVPQRHHVSVPQTQWGFRELPFLVPCAGAGRAPDLMLTKAHFTDGRLGIRGAMWTLPVTSAVTPRHCATQPAGQGSGGCRVGQS